MTECDVVTTFTWRFFSRHYISFQCWYDFCTVSAGLRKLGIWMTNSGLPNIFRWQRRIPCTLDPMHFNPVTKCTSTSLKRQLQQPNKRIKNKIITCTASVWVNKVSWENLILSGNLSPTGGEKFTDRRFNFHRFKWIVFCLVVSRKSQHTRSSHNLKQGHCMQVCTRFHQHA